MNDVNTGYDTYDSCVVVAKTENEAKLIHPRGVIFNTKNEQKDRYDYCDSNWLWSFGSWVNHPDQVKVKLLGTSTNPELSENSVVIASFNAG